MFLAHTPRLVQALLPAYTWRLPDAAEPTIYLTFDDGPIPEVTPWALDTLRAYGARATFFCVGENAERHPDLLSQALAEGHAIGNHTYNHLDGWKTPTLAYAHNVRRCARAVPSRLFRPPYGKLLPRQSAWLRRHFQIVMWDVLSGDYDPRFSPQECLRHVTRHARPGSIVLLHDSLKAERNLRQLLPAALQFFREKGWRMEGLGG
jgi:peptidoglycan-N-acetylglucosamine deacetylase